MKVAIHVEFNDLVILSGDIEAEFSCASDEPFYLAFADGTVIAVVFEDEGDSVDVKMKRIVRGTATITSLSDGIQLQGDLRYVVAGENYAAVGED